MIFTSEIIKCGSPNKDNHIYTKECVNFALERTVVQEQIRSGCFFGEFVEDFKYDFIIDMSKISHVLKEYYWEDNTLYGIFETLETPKGKILEQILCDNPTLKENCMVMYGFGDLNCIDDKTQIVETYILISTGFTLNKA